MLFLPEMNGVTVSASDHSGSFISPSAFITKPGVTFTI